MKRRGSILMEFVIVAPIILLLVSMILQFAHVWTARQITAYAAYCAARSIMAVPRAEQKDAAKKAAELACSWMSLVGMPDAVVAVRDRAATSSTHVRVGRLHGVDEIPTEETVYEYRGEPIAEEVGIPGWGSIPGSDSANARVSVEVVKDGRDAPVAEVTVKFKFPLVLPLAGRMLSWWVNRADEKIDSLDYGSHRTSAGDVPGWSGQEVVMDADGNAVVRNNDGAKVEHGYEGKYPFIVLTETCVLPMPYSTELFPKYGYRRDDDRSGGAVSDLTRGREL